MLQKIKRRGKKFDEDDIIEFSSHSQERMKQRNISKELIERIITSNKKRCKHGGKTIIKSNGYMVVLSDDGQTVVTSYKRK